MLQPNPIFLKFFEGPEFQEYVADKDIIKIK